MKECEYIYIDKDGQPRIAMTIEFMLTIFLVFWALPIVAIVCLIWHSLTKNVKLVTKEDYHKECVQYFKKE